MKKTLIAAAVAAAAAAPAANAGVVIYGQIHASIDWTDEEVCVSGVGCASADQFDVNNRTSRIGFKGSEDLGNGLKAIWKVENSVRITDTSNNPNQWSHNGSSGHWGSARNAYIGLAGDWGTFLYGRHDTPYKMAFYSTGIDMLGDSTIDVNRMYGFTEVRADDAIAYVSPNWNGLTIAAAIVPGEGYTDSTGKVYDGLADNYSIGVMYSNNGLKLAVGYEELNQGLAATLDEPALCATEDCTNMMIGAGYSMNAFDVSAVYAEQEYGALNSDVWAIAAAYTFGNNKVIANYGQNDIEIGGVAGADEDGFGLALQHMFSKRTSAYIAYSTVELGVDVATGDTTEVGTLNEDVLSFGMIHKF